MSNSIEFYFVDIYSNLSFENYQLKNDISLNFFEPIPLNLMPPTTSDIYLSIISALFGFTMLLLLLTLRNSSLPSWGVRCSENCAYGRWSLCCHNCILF